MPKRTRSGKVIKKSKKSYTRMPKNAIRRARVGGSITVHRFKRWTNDNRENVTGTTLSNALTFQLSDVRGASEFNSLYDRYMITCVVVKFRIINNPNANLYINNNATTLFTNSNTANWYPCLYYCVDHDDSNTETLAQIQERAGTKRVILQPNRFYTIKLRPCVTVPAYISSISSGYIPKWNQWIDCGQTGVPHYGLKYVIDTSAVDPIDSYPFVVERSVIYYFKCKDVR